MGIGRQSNFSKPLGTGLRVSIYLKPMHRFMGKFEEEKGILFTESERSEKCTLGLDQEMVNKVM